MMKSEIDRYSFLGRIHSAIKTYYQMKWIDGTKFTKVQRKRRAINNFRDMPSDRKGIFSISNSDAKRDE